MGEKRYKVLLVSTGPREIEVIKVIRYYTDLELKDSKRLAESTPSVVWSDVPQDVALNMVRDLTRVGATAEARDTFSIGPAGGTAGPRRGGRSAPLGDAGRVVRIVDPGPNKIEVVKVIRYYTGLDLKRAKELSESAPEAVCTAMAAADAENMRRDLERVGATAWVADVPAAGASPSDERGAGGDYAVFLINPGSRTIDVIKVVRRYTGMDLKEAKDLVEAGMGPVSSGVSRETAESMWHDLHDAGATVEVRAL